MRVKGTLDSHGETHLRAFQCDTCHGIVTATRNPIVCEDRCGGEYTLAPQNIQNRVDE